MVSTTTRYVFQLRGEMPPATESLRAGDAGRILDVLWHRLAQAEQQAEFRAKVAEERQHHLDCWAKYKHHRQLPPEWRGNTQILHYERIVCQMSRRVLVENEDGFRMTVRRARWLRRIPKAEQQEAVAWFRQLGDDQRQDLCDSYRLEEETREQEERYVESLNRRYARILRD